MPLPVCCTRWPLKHQAPAIFARVTKGGVPGYAMTVTTVTAACGFLTQLVFEDAYIWLVNIVGISGIIMCWASR